ncbi:MAG: HNH endonuclease [Candidatus Latescibacterota bacterium]
MLNRSVLVLNQNYEPLSVCSARRAIVLVVLGKAQVVEDTSMVVRSVSTTFQLPSVVRLDLYVRMPLRHLMLSKRNILKRDGHRCQSCGTVDGPLTLDHVIPKALGGKDTWENLVCACAQCNNRKGQHAPEQMGLELLRMPRRPSTITFIRHFIGVSDHRWKPYLFME